MTWKKKNASIPWKQPDEFKSVFIIKIWLLKFPQFHLAFRLSLCLCWDFFVVKMPLFFIITHIWIYLLWLYYGICLIKASFDLPVTSVCISSPKAKANADCIEFKGKSNFSWQTFITVHNFDRVELYTCSSGQRMLNLYKTLNLFDFLNADLPLSVVDIYEIKSFHKF